MFYFLPHNCRFTVENLFYLKKMQVFRFFWICKDVQQNIKIYIYIYIQIGTIFFLIWSSQKSISKSCNQPKRDVLRFFFKGIRNIYLNIFTLWAISHTFRVDSPPGVGSRKAKKKIGFMIISHNWFQQFENGSKFILAGN